MDIVILCHGMNFPLSCKAFSCCRRRRDGNCFGRNRALHRWRRDFPVEWRRNADHAEGYSSCKAFLTAVSSPPQHGTSIRKIVTLLMSCFTVGDEIFLLNEGETLIMPKDIPHAVYGEEQFKMQLIVSFWCCDENNCTGYLICFLQIVWLERKSHCRTGYYQLVRRWLKISSATAFVTIPMVVPLRLMPVLPMDNIRLQYRMTDRASPLWFK